MHKILYWYQGLLENHLETVLCIRMCFIYACHFHTCSHSKTTQALSPLAISLIPVEACSWAILSVTTAESHFPIRFSSILISLNFITQASMPQIVHPNIYYTCRSCCCQPLQDSQNMSIHGWVNSTIGTL